jgi:hypothetical protein
MVTSTTRYLIFPASHFASGSMDGAVVIWQTESLTPIKILNNPENYRSNDRIYIYNVRSLLSLGDVHVLFIAHILILFIEIFSSKYWKWLQSI